MNAMKDYGYNQRSTPYKQFALIGALGHLLGSSMMVAQKRYAPCVVADMTSGPGCDPNGNDGSPLILAQHLDKWRTQGYDVLLLCVEKNRTYLAQLRGLLGERYPNLAVEYFTAQSEAVANIPKNAVGLTYWDPTRYNDLDRDLLSRFGRSHKYMDILITRECLAGYRMMRAPHCPGTLAMHDYLALTGKRRNYVQQYAAHGWWSLGFADNWETRPRVKMRASGWCDVQSEEGQHLCRMWVSGEKPPRLRVVAKEQPLW